MSDHYAGPEPKSWQQKGSAFLGWAAMIVAAIALGFYVFFSAMTTRLYQTPADVPSSNETTPAERWVASVERARQIARVSISRQNLPGLSAAVGINGEIVWAEGFGWADLERKVPVAPNARFRVGHASKSLTSAGVGLLLDQQRISLDEEIQDYVPAFPQKDWTINLRQLMGHVAGVRHYDGDHEFMPTTHCERAADGLRVFAEDPLRFQPETEFSYSTFGWVVVSAAVEAVAKEPFFTFMRSSVFEPLGMRDTTSDSSTPSPPNLATFYFGRLGGDTTFGADVAATVDYSCFAGAGGFVSTAPDLVRFGMAMSGDTFLKPATIKTLQTEQALLSGEETGFGLGWTIENFPVDGEPTPLASSASRTLLGGSTSLLVFPQRGLTVAVLSNISHADLRSIAVQIARAFVEGDAGALREPAPAR